MKRLILLAVAIALVPAVASAAKSKKRYHVKHSSAATLAAWPGTNSMAPPRMIEIRPGLWISSWGCVAEDAQGRLQDCSFSDGSRN